MSKVFKCPMGTIKVFHEIIDETPEKLDSIKEEGLKTSCRVLAIPADKLSKQRRCSNYAWADLNSVINRIIEDHPVNYPPKVVEVCVNEDTKVYNTAEIEGSVHCVSAKDTLSSIKECMEKSLCDWKDSGIPLKDYKGQYAEPEVLFGDVSAKDINIVSMQDAEISNKSREKLIDYIKAVDEGQKWYRKHPEQKPTEYDESEFVASLFDIIKDIPMQDDVNCVR